MPQQLLRRAAQALGPDTAQLLTWVERQAGTAGGLGALGPRPPFPILTPFNGLGLAASPQGYAAGEVVFALPLPVWGPTSAQFALEKAQATAPAFYQSLRAVDEDLGGGKQKLLQPVALATHLSLALLDPHDAVHPYARFLYETSQKMVPHPLLLSPQDLKEGLQASPVVAAVKKRQELFTHVHHRLFGGAAAAATAAAAQASLPRSVFLWSISRVLSRAISGPGKPLTFLPFFDLINHRRTEAANCEYALDIKESVVFVKATRKVEGGEELFLCYSDSKDNHLTFVTYGFVERENPVGVKIKVALTETEGGEEGGAGGVGEWVIGGGDMDGEEEEKVRFERALAAVRGREKGRRGLSEGEGRGVMKRAVERCLREYETSLEEDRVALREVEEEGGREEGEEGGEEELAWRRTTLALLVEEKVCLQRALDRVSGMEKGGH